MSKWIPCGERFIVGDVIRWTETIWLELRKTRKGKKKVEKLGERRVTAEVLRVDDRGYVYLSVCCCEIVANKHGLPLKPFEKEQVLRKQRSTIGKGSGERLKWSDEAARSLAASKFLN